MAKYKGVWFSESDPTKWFEESEDAREFDKIAEVVEWIKANDDTRRPTQISDIVKRICERYTLEQRYDWKEPEKENQE